MARPPRTVATLVTGEYFQIAKKGLIAAAGSTSVNTVFLFHFRRSGGTTTPSKANLNTAFETAIGSVIAAALNIRWSATVNEIRRMNDALDPNVAFSLTQSGAITGDSMPSDQAAYLRLRTGLRRYLGSKHLGPMSESDTTTTSDQFNADCLTRLTAIVTAIVNGFTDSDGNIWKSSVFNFKDSVAATNPTILYANDVTEGAVNHTVGNMRRRKTASVY